MPCLGVLEVLPIGCEQFLRMGEIRLRAPRETKPEKDLSSMGQRPCLPNCVARPAEVGQSAAQVLVRLVEPAQVPKDGSTPHEHAPGRTATRGFYRLVQNGQPLPAAPSPRESHSEGGLHVHLTLKPA